MPDLLKKLRNEMLSFCLPHLSKHMVPPTFGIQPRTDSSNLNWTFGLVEAYKHPYWSLDSRKLPDVLEFYVTLGVSSFWLDIGPLTSSLTDGDKKKILRSFTIPGPIEVHVVSWSSRDWFFYLCSWSVQGILNM